MSYIGTVDMNDANIKHYSLTGSTLTVIPIGWVPASEQSLRVTINGVVQQGDTFSYSGSNLTLGGPLVVTDTLEVVGIQSVGNMITPADNSVTTAKLADDAVTLAKMAGGTDGNLITYDASGNPAYVATGSATNILTSNGAGAAPTFQAAAVAANNTPSFCAYNNATQNLTAAAFTLIAANTEVYDTASGYDTSTYIYTVPTAGKYFVFCGCRLAHSSGADIASIGVAIYKDGIKDDGLYAFQSTPGSGHYPRWMAMYASTVLDLGIGDELKWYVYTDENVGGGQFVQLQPNQYQNSWGAFKLAGV